jgi:hypothetical protein
MSEVSAEEKARMLIEGVKSALAQGVKHYHPKTGVELTTIFEILTVLREEGSVDLSRAGEPGDEPQDVDPGIAEQRDIDEGARRMAQEIVDGQNLKTLEEAKRFAQRWIETAAQHARNEEHYRKGREEAHMAGRAEVLAWLRGGAPSSWCTYAIREGLADEFAASVEGPGTMKKEIS